MNARRTLRDWRAISLASLAAAGCQRELPPGPDTSLEMVRRALATHDGSLDAHTDARFVADVAYMRAGVEAIRYAGHGHEGHSETLTPSLFVRTWQTHNELRHDPLPALRPALAWLGGGRCARLSTAPVPEAFAPLPPAEPSWPESLRARHAEVSAALRAVFAQRYQCAPGIPVVVTFLPAPAAGQAPRVLSITRG